MPHITRRRFLSDSTIAAAFLAAGSGSSFISNAAEAPAADEVSFAKPIAAAVGTQSVWEM